MDAKHLLFVLCLGASVSVVAQRGGGRSATPPPSPAVLPDPTHPSGQPSKAPEQGWVGDGWYPHEGGLLKMKVQIRFGVEIQHDVKPEEWKQMPSGWVFGRVSAVSTDSHANVYVLHRNTQIDPLVIFDQNGNYLRSWGKGVIMDPHGIRVDKHDNVWVVDRAGQIIKYTPDGKVQWKVGTAGQRGTDDHTFNLPTDVAWDSQDNTYISDGYGNSRVVKFDKNGKYVKDWGTAGSAPGQFNTPHSIQFDSKDRAYVSDRENNRIQIFDTDGKLIKIWNHLGSTQGIWISPKDEMYILTHRNNVENITADTLAGRLMHIDLESGKVLGAMESPGHEISGSPNGDIFVASLTGNVLRWMPHPQFSRSH
jgi:DNA-binding beta-propeller fold protein YncE